MDLRERTGADPLWWDRTRLRLWQDEASWQQSGVARLVAADLPRAVTTVLEKEPQLVGLSVYSTLASVALARALRAARPGLRIVAGGQLCSPGLRGLRLARSGAFDAVVHGEGERPLLQLVEGAAPDSIGGLLIPHAGGVEDTGAGAQVSLDELPWPDWDGVDFDRYSHPLRAASMLLSRGCVRDCDFCHQSWSWGGYRYRDADDVYAEMAALASQRGVRHVHFNDLLVNGSGRQLDRLCALLIERPLGLSWAGNAIVSPNLSEERLTHMRAAGCEKLGFGFESFSEPVLRAMGKGHGPDAILTLLERLHRVGLPFFSNLIVGHPAEGEAEFQQTLDFLARHARLFPEPPTASLLIVQRDTPIDHDADRWGLCTWPDDPLDWWLDDGSNTLGVRRARAARLSEWYKRHFGAPARITDHAEDLEPVGARR